MTNRRVLIPLEHTECGQDVFQWYTFHLARPGDIVLFFHLVHGPKSSITTPMAYVHHGIIEPVKSSVSRSPRSTMSNGKDETLDEELATKANEIYDYFVKQVEQLAQKLTMNPNSEVLCGNNLEIIEHRVCVQRGTHAGKAIVDAQTWFGADCIVMGSRDLNIIKRTFLGSVSTYVMHNVSVATIIVPPCQPLV
ncbi:hypothetical protein EG68_05128 [Paragonimus skrjabini miyazakii]|uniref:UspA domain-containing protein n=1 Tax=Paragonimus skrjabini miyazakii TaxID=59628 RepID=A0A8S9YX97_9TREM|nr:hypothetical protein EG68_05128 [Paragonimus skrjabini miyazakii]